MKALAKSKWQDICVLYEKYWDDPDINIKMAQADSIVKEAGIAHDSGKVLYQPIISIDIKPEEAAYKNLFTCYLSEPILKPGTFIKDVDGIAQKGKIIINQRK